MNRTHDSRLLAKLQLNARTADIIPIPSQAPQVSYPTKIKKTALK